MDGAGGERPSPLFFLSYSRSADRDEQRSVQRLFHDLSTEVRRLLPEASGAGVGFLDLPLDGSGGWTESLTDALASCRVFVALLSPDYFNSEWCGREWDAFSHRPPESPSGGILPVLWQPSHTRSSALNRHTALDLTAAPGALRDLMLDRRRRDDYRASVGVLAQRIVEVTALHEPASPGRDVPQPHAGHLLSGAGGVGIRRSSGRVPLLMGPTSPTAFHRPVFLSYSRANQSYVDRLALYLSSHGIEVWYDDELACGDQFDKVIQRRIEDCSAFIVVLSPDALESEWVERETSYAVKLRKPVYPLMLSPCELPFLIHNRHCELVSDGRMPSERFVAAVLSSSGPGRMRPPAA